MAQGYDTEEQKERVLLVGVQLDNQEDMESSLEELKALAKTAGAETVGKVIQPRDAYHPATYIGKGKLEEVRSLIEETGATGIICDDELSPAQLRNLEDALGTKVMDRTMVILDIFASRATTSEGKIQVEVAQLKYRSTRLTGLGTTLSRLGGGIGTRGPGEKKLETDRRIIRDRISRLSKDLEEIKNHREVARQNRSRTAVPVAAIVGYTNAGKSTLLNMLAGLERPTRGEIVIAGKHIEKLSEKALVAFRRERVGFIFQSYNLLNTMNAVENVAMPLSFRGMAKKERMDRAKKYLNLVGVGDQAKHMPNQMSGGQQQRVGIARALVVNPQIIFADEPTGNLDSKTTMEVMRLMQKIVRERQQTLVMVTHDNNLASYADRQIRIIDGKIVEIIENTPQEYAAQED